MAHARRRVAVAVWMSFRLSAHSCRLPSTLMPTLNQLPPTPTDSHRLLPILPTRAPLCAQCHYPFENKESFEASFPADFIAEGIDQTRGWFYTLMVLSTALFDQPAFKNLICNGLVRAEDGLHGL